MYMDLTDMISGGTEEQPIPEQKLTKEEYAAKKQQEREEVWAEVDSQAQGVFQDGEKLKGFLDFMAECNTQRTGVCSTGPAYRNLQPTESQCTGLLCSLCDCETLWCRCYRIQSGVYCTEE